MCMCVYLYTCTCRRVWGCVPWKPHWVEEHGKGASRCQNTERYIIIGASVSEPPLVDSTDALSRYIYIYYR